MKALVDYLDTLTVTQGEGAGGPFPVLPWQRRFVRGAFGVRGNSALSVARGNGKTTLVAGIGAAALEGPLRVARGEVVIVASSFEQARVAFEHTYAFMQAKGHDLDNRKRWRVWDTAQQARIECRETGARVRCIGSDPKRAHGLAPLIVLADEPAQWGAQGDAMRAALRTSMGKVKGSRLIALGTRPKSSLHWFARMLEGSGAAYAQSHAARPDDRRFTMQTWRKANPSLPYMPELLATIREEADEAKRDPALLASFEALRLNLGTSDTQETTLLDAGTWERIEGDAEAAGEYILGVDLGSGAAMSAVAAYWPGSGRLDVRAAFPAHPELGERGLQDGVGRLYLDMHRRGELVTLGEHVSDVGGLLRLAFNTWGRPGAVVCDRWREAELREALSAVSFPMTALVLRGMGFQDGGEDVRRFRKAALAGEVRPLVSLLMRSAMSEARCIMDPAGNSKLCKGTEGGRRLRARDDAVAAAILAVAEGSRRGAKPRAAGLYLGIA